LRDFAANPLRWLVSRWNWKAALWSGLYRIPPFLGAAANEGIGAALAAGGIEFVYRAGVSGFAAAITQALRHAEPRALAVTIVLLVVPGILHFLEWLIHHFAGTPNLKTSVIISVAMTVLATLFNLYAMRQGVLLTGREGRPLLSDIVSLPRVVAGFLAWPIVSLVRALRTQQKRQ